MDILCSLQSTGNRDCWALDQPPQKSLRKDSDSKRFLPMHPGPHNIVRQCGHWMQLSPKRVPLGYQNKRGERLSTPILKIRYSILKIWRMICLSPLTATTPGQPVCYICWVATQTKGDLPYPNLNVVQILGFSCWTDTVLDHEDNDHLVGYSSLRSHPGQVEDIIGLCKFIKNVLFPLAPDPSR